MDSYSSMREEVLSYGFNRETCRFSVLKNDQEVFSFSGHQAVVFSDFVASAIKDFKDFGCLVTEQLSKEQHDHFRQLHEEQEYGGVQNGN
jgi:hypothetical protein